LGLCPVLMEYKNSRQLRLLLRLGILVPLSISLMDYFDLFSTWSRKTAG
jgi:hypothetical protein